MKKSKLIGIVLLFLVFVTTRIIILKNPPTDYSDVKQDYERYANMWWYGLPPYLKHFYEYPPATVPLVIFPLLFDQLGIGKYYQNYRIQIFFFEIFLFIFTLKALEKLKLSNKSKLLSLSFYLLIPVLAKDFYYEGIDLIFSGTLVICLISILIYQQNKLRNRIATWALFWWSFALKFLNLPLLLIIYLTKKLKIKKEIITLIIGLLLIWLVPLIVFRSSLSVSLVFHKNRPLKYSSFGDCVIQGINFLTLTDDRPMNPPDFAFVGPVSTIVNKIFIILFPTSILAVLAYSIFKLIKKSSKNKLKNAIQLILSDSEIKMNNYNFTIKTTLLLFLTMFITSRTVSQPFVIWFIPLLTVFPYKNIKQQLFFFIGALFLIILMAFPLSFIPDSKEFVGPFTYDFLLDTIRFGTIFTLIYLSLQSFSHEKNH